MKITANELPAPRGGVKLRRDPDRATEGSIGARSHRSRTTDQTVASSQIELREGRAGQAGSAPSAELTRAPRATILRPMEGVLNIDKPAGPSSARVVGQIKRLLPRGTKIGHAGTLDPFATGVLLLLIGRATRCCESLMDQPKQYEATVKFGATTETDDPESEERPVPGAAPVSRERIQDAIRQFSGEIIQKPPAFSAMKVGGRRAYQIARSGGIPELKPRKVQVYGIEIVSYDWPLLRLRIDCGRGTYIRAIARDLGSALQTGGYLTQLRRTRVGEFRVESAITPQSLTAETLPARLVPIGPIHRK